MSVVRDETDWRGIRWCRMSAAAATLPYQR
jgi:hypothetical protein